MHVRQWIYTTKTILMLGKSYLILSDAACSSLLTLAKSGKTVLLPRKRFAALCLQAMGNADVNPSQVLVPCDQIRNLMTDPLNATIAALPIDTLRRLFLQAMIGPDGTSPATLTMYLPAPAVFANQDGPPG